MKLHIILLHASLFNLATVLGQFEAPKSAPVGSYPKYFNYYTPGSANMPEGANIASKAIMMVGTLKLYAGRVVPSLATMFIVPSKRKDHKLCLCGAGHSLEGSLRPKNVLGKDFSFTGYMDYRGKPSDSNANYNQVVSGYKSIMHGTTVASYFDSAKHVPDAILVLINPEELPVKDFAALGVSFKPSVIDNAATFFSINHVNAMPQMIMDNLTRSAEDSKSDFDFIFYNSLNTSFGPVASGAPLIHKNPGAPTVFGIYKGAINNINLKPIPDDELVGKDALYPGFYKYRVGELIATRMSVLRQDIIKHCLENDSTGDFEKDYMKSVLVDNSAGRTEFDIDKTITSMAGLNTAATASFTASNPGSTLVKGNKVVFSCPITSSINSKNIYGLASTIILAQGFSYTASGDNIFEMNVVVVVPEQIGTAITARNSFTDKKVLHNTPSSFNNKPATPSAGFKISPNPSATGVFEITTPVHEASKKYALAITTIDGKPVEQGNIQTGEHIQIDISRSAHGQYILQIYEGNSIVYTTVLIY